MTARQILVFVRSASVLATVLGACALAAIAAVGCLSKPRFECAGNAECVQGAAQGTCQPDNLCSFPDPSCPSGERYGDLSGPQANQCVGGEPDAMTDAGEIDTPPADARQCFGSGAYELCYPAPPMGPVNIAGTINTDSDPRCAAPPASWTTAGQPNACVIAGGEVTIATVAVTGTKALVIVGETIAISGTLDVASHRGGTTGPNAPFGGCTAFPTGPGNDATGAGGGAGATFKTKGGNGGNGDAPTVGGTSPAALGTNPTVLRAGCPGQTGGTGQAGAGTRGQGGGAVFLAASTITFGAAGVINASGAGAAGGGALSGGSGGGSGGMIVLHAQAIIGNAGARVLANGGGGAAGASGIAGGDGGDPNPATATTPGQGGAGGGGAGGNGFAGPLQAQSGSALNNRGGGGGGGGGGFIQTNKPLTNVTTSPAATVIP